MTGFGARAKIAGLLLCLAALGFVAVATAETVQHGNLRVSFEGKISPKALPRTAAAAIRVSLSTKIASTNAKPPPPLNQISLAINKYGKLDATGLPVCQYEDIQPATTDDALAVCKSSLVGQGRFLAAVLIKGQAPFPSDGRIYAFNGEFNGRPAILAHVYGTQPAPTSFTLPFVITRSKGTFGTLLAAKLPTVKNGAGYITGISLDLGKSYSYRGKRRSYFSGSCPAPKGFPGAPFPLARVSVGFQGGRQVGAVLTRNCKVR